MEVLVGTDIIEVSRIKEAMKDGNFERKVFTQKEIEYCERKNENIKYQHYSARFAAKEAIYKAISKCLEDKYDITWKNIEITNDENNRPVAKIVESLDSNEQNKNTIEKLIKNNIKIDISISHIKELAVATAVVMLENK